MAIELAEKGGKREEEEEEEGMWCAVVSHKA
jgi:hypothetical protein